MTSMYRYIFGVLQKCRHVVLVAEIIIKLTKIRGYMHVYEFVNDGCSNSLKTCRFPAGTDLGLVTLSV